MKPTFLNHEQPLLTVMLQCETPEVVSGRIRNANCLGADAYGLQVEAMKNEYHTPETYKRIFAEMKGRPVYVTNYRSRYNTGLSDDEIAQGLVTLAENGATLCDVMGDMFCRHPDELTTDETAVAKQMAYIKELHDMGAEVLMSSHLGKYAPSNRIMEIAEAQKARGADVIKIVTDAKNATQEIEHLATLDRLHRELGRPFLFLSGGHCKIIRRIGILMGCCMCLCVHEHDELATKVQPLLCKVKAIRDNFQ